MGWSGGQAVHFPMMGQTLMNASRGGRQPSARGKYMSRQRYALAPNFTVRTVRSRAYGGGQKGR